MGVGGESASIRLLAEAVEVLLLEPALQERARVDAGRRMSLDVHEIAAVLGGRRVPEVVEPDLVQGGGGGEARDVAPELGALAVRLHHHRHRVPPHERANAPFDRRVSGGVALARFRNGVEVGGVGRVGEVGAGAARFRDEVLDEEVGARDPVAFQHRLERLQPLLGLRRIDVVTGLRLNPCDHSRSRLRPAVRQPGVPAGLYQHRRGMVSATRSEAAVRPRSGGTNAATSPPDLPPVPRFPAGGGGRRDRGVQPRDRRPAGNRGGAARPGRGGEMEPAREPVVPRRAVPGGQHRSQGARVQRHHPRPPATRGEDGARGAPARMRADPGPAP